MALNPVCRGVRFHLSEMLDNFSVQLSKKTLVYDHLRVCAECTRFHQSLAATVEALRALRTSDDA